MNVENIRAKAIERFRNSIERKREWKRELEMEYAAKGESVNVVLL